MRKLIETLESRKLLSATWYVDANAAGATHDGTTWDSAYLEIQQALGSAAAGDEIRVADGIYAVSDPSPIQLKNGVKLLGGFAGSGSIVPNARDVVALPSIITGSGTTANSGLLVGSGTDATAQLDGFTLQSDHFSGRSVYNDAGSPTISNCTFKGGMGLFNVNSSPMISNCLFNSVEGDDGGAMTNSNSSPIIVNSQFINCHGVTGGAMRNNFGSSPTITGCIFTGNHAAHEGQAIYSYSSSMTMSSCTFQNNGQFSGAGGAIYAIGSSSLVISDTCFTGNTSGNSTGGAICASGTLVLTNCNFDSNHASNNGGAIYSTASLTLTNCAFSGNGASGGGAVYVAGGSLSATNSSFTGNSATFGGAIYAGSSSGSPILTKCSFTDNTAQYGGGMYNYGNSPRLTGCTFTRNRAAQVINNSSGGALHNNNAAVSVVDCAFFGNSAYDGGAVADISGVSSTFVNTLFVGNFTFGYAGWGGAIRLENGTTPVTTIINCTFAYNSANRGGAITRAIPSGPMHLINSILWGNAAATGANIYNPSSSPVVYLNLYTGDPQFLRTPSSGADNAWGTPDDDYGDLRLKLNSPCIDAGDTASVPIGISTDLAGNPRIVDIPAINDPGNIVDIGAYEYQFPLVATGGAYAFDAPNPTIILTFNGDVDTATLAASDLALLNPATNLAIVGLPPASFSYDPGTRTAKWVFPSPLPDGNYRAKIAAGSVTDTAGNPLSADFVLDFFVLPGDANRDRIVDVNDLTILATNWYGTAKTFSQGDFNHDGVVNQTDLGILALHWQQKLVPPPLPSAPVPTQVAVRAARKPTRIASDVIL